MKRKTQSRKSRRKARSRSPSAPHSGMERGPDVKRAASAATISSGLQSATGADAIESVSIESLKSNPRNARRHSDRQIEQIAASIRQFGFNNPLIVDENDQVLAGHGRLQAAKKLSLKSVPCVRIGHLTPEAKRAYVLADNRLAELSDWDDDLLAAELEELSSIELDFDVEITGFDTVDLDRMLGPEPDPNERDGDGNGISTNPDDQIPPLLQKPISRPGDLWLLGSHRVLCGNALEAECYARLLQGEIATQVFADPPYNVRVARHVTSKAGFREFPMASGELSSEEFVNFLAGFLREASGCSVDGAILHVCMDWRHIEELLQAARVARLTLMNICTWAKPQAGMGTIYRSQTEFVVVLKKGSGPHINTFGLGARGRYRTNLWRYPSVHGPRRGVNAPESGGHPTVKAVSMVIDALRDCSHRGDVVLDPFGGSGTTLIAAERIGRRARLIELDPAYVDLIARRWHAVFGQSATLARDGRTFDEISTERNANRQNKPSSESATDDQEI